MYYRNNNNNTTCIYLPNIINYYIISTPKERDFIMEIRMALDGKARDERTIKLQRHTLKVTSLLLSIITLSRWTYKHVLGEII